MSAYLVDCCTKRNIKTLREDNAVCLNCQRHYYEGREYTKKEWDALMETAEIVQAKPKGQKSCETCVFCTRIGESLFCEDTDGGPEILLPHEIFAPCRVMTRAT